MNQCRILTLLFIICLLCVCETFNTPQETIIDLIIQPGPGKSQDCNTIYSYDLIGSSTWENYNTGLNSIIAVGVYDKNSVLRTLLRFDLPDSLSRYQLQSAKLVLHIYKWVQKDIDTALQINIHKMLRSWKQGNFNGGFYEKGRNNQTIDGATALERFFGQQDGTEKWSVPGIGMNDIDASSKIYASSVHAYNDTTPYQFDITELVSQWLTNKESNSGVLLRSPADQGVKGKNYSYPEFFAGDDSSNAEKRPKLLLVLKPR